MLTWVRKILHGDASEAADWHRAWDARVAAMESVLGKCDGTVYHAPPPAHLDGFADVLRFRNHLPGGGVAYVTCDLIGNPRQPPNRFGQYELMLCTREESAWAPSILSHLARYTHDAALQPGDTMDLALAVPAGSTIGALLFAMPECANPRLTVLGNPATLLLCIGITDDEFVACKAQHSRAVLRALKDAGVLPFTDLRRESVAPLPAR